MRWRIFSIPLASFLLIVCYKLASAGQLTIVALGASNTAGYGVTSAEAYPIVLEGMLRAHEISARVINAGINGDTLKAMLARLDTAVVPGTQLVILDATRNGYGDKGAEWANDLAEIKHRLKARAIKVIVIYPFRYYLAMRQPDHIHLSAEAHARLAARLLPAIMAAASVLTGGR